MSVLNSALRRIITNSVSGLSKLLHSRPNFNLIVKSAPILKIAKVLNGYLLDYLQVQHESSRFYEKVDSAKRTSAPELDIDVWPKRKLGR